MEEKVMNIVKFQHPRYNVNQSLLDELFNNFLVNDYHESYCGKSPATNVLETEKDFRIEVSLPGYDKNEVELKFHKNILNIKAEHKVEENEKAENSYRYFHREFGNVNFEKKFKVPETVNGEKITAEFKNGILVITLPKKEEALEKEPLAISIS